MRDNLLILASGKKRIGKSHETLKQLIFYAYVCDNRQKSLIFDINNEYGRYEIDGTFHKIKRIGSTERDIVRYSNQPQADVVRIVPIHENGRPMSSDEAEALALRAITLFRGGILFLEDFNYLFGDSLPQKVSSALTNNAHRSCDIMITVQSIGRLLPKMLQNVNLFRFHQQLDDVENSRDKIGKAEFPIFKIAQIMVNKRVEEGDIRFFVYVDKDAYKLRGQFSPRQLTEAIQEYLYQYPSEINLLIRRRDVSGRQLYGWEEAFRIRTIELYRKYQGN